MSSRIKVMRQRHLMRKEHLRRAGVAGVMNLVLPSICLLGLAFAPPAKADVDLELTDGVNFVSLGSAGGVHSGALSCDQLLGTCQFIGTVGDWSVNVTSGVAAPPGTLSGPLPHLDLNSSDVYLTSSGGAGNPGPLFILFTDTGLSLPSAQMGLTIGGTNTNTALSNYGWYDSNDQLFGRDRFAPLLGDADSHTGGTLIGCLAGADPTCVNSFSNGPFSGSTAGDGPGLTPNSYSVTQAVVITPTGPAGIVSFADALQTVPEPSSIPFLGSIVLLVIPAIGRKMRRGISA